MQEYRNFDARTTMGELNYLSEMINEQGVLRNSIVQECKYRRIPIKREDRKLSQFHTNFFSFRGTGFSWLVVLLPFSFSIQYLVKEQYTAFILLIVLGFVFILFRKKIQKLLSKIDQLNPAQTVNLKDDNNVKIIDYLEATENEIDEIVKREWNPRIRVLRENSINFLSNKELREDYNILLENDIEIQRLTSAGRQREETINTLKIAGVATLAITGVALGAMSAANRSFNKQWFFDH